MTPLAYRLLPGELLPQEPRGGASPVWSPRAEARLVQVHTFEHLIFGVGEAEPEVGNECFAGTRFVAAEWQHEFERCTAQTEVMSLDREVLCSEKS